MTQSKISQHQWLISTMITLLTIGAVFVYNNGVSAQQMLDTTKQIEERKKVDEAIMLSIKEDKKEQAETNKDMVTALTDLKMAIVELRTVLKAKK